MLRRNVSGTPDFETENAQITVAQFYIDAQRANGTLVMDEDVLLDDERHPVDGQGRRAAAGHPRVLRGDG